MNISQVNKHKSYQKKPAENYSTFNGTRDYEYSQTCKSGLSFQRQCNQATSCDKLNVSEGPTRSVPVLSGHPIYNEYVQTCKRGLGF